MRVYEAGFDLKTRAQAGHTVTIAAVTGAYTSTGSDATIDDLPPGAESEGDGYERGTATLAWDDATDTVRVTDWPILFDLSDEPNLAGFVLEDDDDGALIIEISYPTAQAGTTDWGFDPDDGIVASLLDGSFVAAQLANHESRIAALEAIIDGGTP